MPSRIFSGVKSECARGSQRLKSNSVFMKDLFLLSETGECDVRLSFFDLLCSEMKE